MRRIGTVDVMRVPGGWIIRHGSDHGTYVPDPRVYYNRSNPKAANEAEELERILDKVLTDAR